MTMLSSLSPFYLCNFDEEYTGSDDLIDKIRTNQWSIEQTDVFKGILATKLENSALSSFMKCVLEDNIKKKEVIRIAICSILKFMDANWNSQPEPFRLRDFLGCDWPKDVDVGVILQRDSEPLYVNIIYPELLYLSSQLFGVLNNYEPNLIYQWWCFRCKIIHQRILEDTSATLFSELEVTIAKLLNEMQNSDILITKPRLKLLLYIEISQAYLLYSRVQKVEEYLLKAKEIAGLKLELTGVLGKRTRFQQEALPQLALSHQLDESINRPTAEQSHGASGLPPEIELHDDVRLNKIQYNSNILQDELPSLEQILCLLTVQYLQKAQAKDDLMEEELKPYIEAVLSQTKGAWITRVAALLLRCKLEANHKRTVERAMRQCESIVNEATGVTATTRLSYLLASGIQPAWTWRQQLGDLYLSMGLVKAALEEYKKLHLWEDVIVCYTILQLRHKAAEVIQRQIDIKPTVKLYCLLGDATDDIAQYEKAWEFSQHKSSRAQRHWGNYLFDRKKYEECIPHFEKSLEINSIQEKVWLRLGYAALMTKNWETSAAAYRRYTYLQPNSFEAWNNLAKVYVNQGDKERAHRALMEALRFNYDNWKLWENVIVISTDTGHFEDVIRGIHRLLDLQHKYEDIEVLTLLVKAIVEDQKDADGNAVSRLRKRVLELFGRLTSVHQNKPELWQLYADISPTYLLRAQRLLKAYKGFTMVGNWPNNPVTCKNVVELAIVMLDYSLKACQEVDDKEKLQANQQISSARLTGQAVLRAAEKQRWPETLDVLEELQAIVENVTEYMKSTV